MTALYHCKLDVYHRALDLLDHDHIHEAMPPGRAQLKDQLDRAMTSVVLNIAEGAGEFSKDEKQRFYRIAPARELLVRVVSMLARLASS